MGPRRGVDDAVRTEPTGRRRCKIVIRLVAGVQLWRYFPAVAGEWG